MRRRQHDTQEKVAQKNQGKEDSQGSQILQVVNRLRNSTTQHVIIQPPKMKIQSL